MYNVFKENNITCHGYADDTQFYLAYSANDIETTKTQIVNVLNTLGNWLAQHKLKLNPDKTEIIVFSNDFQKLDIHVNGTNLTSSSFVRNLGVILDDKLTFETHIKNM